MGNTARFLHVHHSVIKIVPGEVHECHEPAILWNFELGQVLRKSGKVLNRLWLCKVCCFLLKSAWFQKMLCPFKCYISVWNSSAEPSWLATISVNVCAYCIPKLRINLFNEIINVDCLFKGNLVILCYKCFDLRKHRLVYTVWLGVRISMPCTSALSHLVLI